MEKRKKPSPKHRQKVIEFNPFDTSVSIEALKEIAERSKGDLGIHLAADGKGVTFGPPLRYGEYEGEGLPGDAEPKPVSFSFDMRFILNDDGSVELHLAKKGAGRHFKWPFSGVDKSIAWKAIVGMITSYDQHLIASIYDLFWAYYHRENPDSKRRKEVYERIMSNVETNFKQRLRIWERYKVIDEEVVHGLPIKTYAPIEQGRKSQSEGEIEQEKSRFLEDVIKAFRKLDREGRTRTQYNAAMEIFDGEHNKARKELEKAIGNRLRKFGLKWKQLISDYEQENP